MRVVEGPFIIHRSVSPTDRSAGSEERVGSAAVEVRDVLGWIVGTIRANQGVYFSIECYQLGMCDLVRL